jgi:hypothetical protein
MGGIIILVFRPNKEFSSGQVIFIFCHLFILNSQQKCVLQAQLQGIYS